MYGQIPVRGSETHFTGTGREEASIVRRAKRQSPYCAQNADVEDYRYATALESLFGYLELTGRKTRLEELVDKVIAVIERSMGVKNE